MYKPRIIEALAGIHMRKVACGSQSTLGLTSSGQVQFDVFGYCYSTFYGYTTILSATATMQKRNYNSSGLMVIQLLRTALCRYTLHLC